MNIIKILQLIKYGINESNENTNVESKGGSWTVLLAAFQKDSQTPDGFVETQE